jgi:hypothetical protein
VEQRGDQGQAENPELADLGAARCPLQNKQASQQGEVLA